MVAQADPSPILHRRDRESVQVSSGRHHESQGAIDNSTRVLSPIDERPDICAQRCYRKQGTQEARLCEDRGFPLAGAERRVSIFWRDDGVDGVHDMLGAGPLQFFFVSCPFFLRVGGMQDPNPVMYSKTLRSTSTHHC